MGISNMRLLETLKYGLQRCRLISRVEHSANIATKDHLETAFERLRADNAKLKSDLMLFTGIMIGVGVGVGVVSTIVIVFS